MLTSTSTDEILSHPRHVSLERILFTFLSESIKVASPVPISDSLVQFSFTSVSGSQLKTDTSEEVCVSGENVFR